MIAIAKKSRGGLHVLLIYSGMTIRWVSWPSQEDLRNDDGLFFRLYNYYCLMNNTFQGVDWFDHLCMLAFDMSLKDDGFHDMYKFVQVFYLELCYQKREVFAYTYLLFNN